MKFCVIGSGSGNMTYIETSETKVLLDAGISFRGAQKRVEDHGIDLAGAGAVIITHEHYDHVSFLASVLKRTQADLYINRQSFDRLDYRIGKPARVRLSFSRPIRVM